jgi:SAM-dependent methyltransferase
MADAEIEAFVREWNRTLVERDLEGAAALRADGYIVSLPEGDVLDRAEELAFLGRPDSRFDSIQVGSLTVERRAAEATATFENRIQGTFEGEPVRGRYRYTLACRKARGMWLAVSARVEELDDPGAGSGGRPTGTGLRLLAGRLVRALGLRNPARTRARRLTLPKLAWIPYRAGEDYVLPPPVHRGADEALPIPPESLWTDVRYSAHGEEQVGTMLRLVEASGFAFRDGDRILDLGCGSGRMIRHLLPLAGGCEIWGTDIEAESILWCQRHLSPPFHFATTTKFPHLPFEDRSFRFVYCGSLFTHIDDLADAWLLELRRILAPDGRLYLTLHDNSTIEQLEAGRHARSPMAQELRASPTYRAAVQGGFAMFTIGRDSESQVFYDRDWFERRAAPSFEVLSVTERAYYYQTGYLLAPKARA